ncbi:aminopeptidase [Paracoccaceae bacterium]|nr:aminopeptidase [Paracoccaceae bacterium]
MSNTSLISSAHIDRLAELAVKTGLALKPGQDLMITAPIEALPLVRKITDHAYKSGACVVTPIFSDPEMVLSRYRNALDPSFDQAANWLYDGMGAAFDNNTARLAVVGDDPMLLANEDPEKVGRVNKANSQALTPARERITRFDINWNIVAWPGLAWAKRMFPDLPKNEAQAKLAEAIFSASRVNVSNPIEAWNNHNKNLRERSDWLNQQNFASLHFSGPGTDLTVGLADGHEWMGGASLARNGITCNPNIPSEEVFTTPHCMKVQGKVSSTKPLSHQGTLIDNICVKFEAGSITEAHASKGEEVLLKVLDSDEGARRLGEVALVPHSSPISQSGLLFYNTLFDENAASHIALGQCYSKCFKGGENLSKDEIIKRGGNSSMIHIDWMIGSEEINVDGMNSNGAYIPIFRNGEWAG